MRLCFYYVLLKCVTCCLCLCAVEPQAVQKAKDAIAKKTTESEAKVGTLKLGQTFQCWWWAG